MQRSGSVSRAGEGTMKTLRPLLLATRSEGKLRELLPLVTEAGFQVETLADVGIGEHADEERLETFATFEENAFAKARYFSRLVPGRFVLADDSGLEVSALAGAPGVMSKRWSMVEGLAGVELDLANNQRLLRELKIAGAMSTELRGARFVCAAVCVGGGVELFAEGYSSGSILMESGGDKGFGYDPYFLSSEHGRAFGELEVRQKSAVSHRSRAFGELFTKLSALCG